MMSVLSFEIVIAVCYDVISVTSVMHCDIIDVTRGHAYHVIVHNSYNVKTQHTNHHCRRMTSIM